MADESAAADAMSRRQCPITEETDEDLATLVATDDREAALTELIRRYAPRLRRLLYTLVGGSDELVEDAEQEVFVSMIRNLGRFRRESSFSTFFYSLARNRITDLLRSRKRRRDRYGAIGDPDDAESSFAGPERIALDRERIEALDAALDVLNPTDRLMLVLKDGENVTVEELSRVFALPGGTVKSRLARSRRKVERRMEGMGHG